MESPVQLLHVLEWCAWHQSKDLRLAVLSPRDAHGRDQLATMRTLAQDSGIDVVWLDPRVSRFAPLGAWRKLRRWAGEADRVVVGDPFSGLIQSVLVTTRIEKVTVIDDGTATIDFAELLRSQEPLLRWTVRRGWVTHAIRTPLARRANRYLGQLGPDALELFTVMPICDLPHATVTRHRYQWTRRRFGPPTLHNGVTVVGSSLVESGLLSEEVYLQAITEQLDVLGAPGGVYISHRRERSSKVRRLIAATKLKLVTSQLPLEIELRKGPVGRAVICFPSTPAFTLPLVLDGAGTRLRVVPLRASRLSPQAEPRARDFLLRIGAQVSPDDAAGDERADHR
ncbi:hypothetical protein [Propionicimonas paludicola]|uniref:hypothetical protein n=1 Tax=Propionicimonas paludicola TaxID=185243 RepID=UPI00117B3AD3|nr:hypothetical protein [Propionicimonas paludicola]